MYREKQSPSLCPIKCPLLRLCVYENHRIKGQAIGQHLLASLKLLHDPYLAIAGVGPVLLKPRNNVSEGKRTDSISMMGRFSTARRMFLGTAAKGLCSTHFWSRSQGETSLKEIAAISGNVVQSIVRVFTGYIETIQTSKQDVHKC